MFIVLADQHHLHPTAERMPGYGRRYPEVPARIDRIRFALEAAGYGPLAAPTDFGMGPIEAVHTAELVRHLQTAWERSRPDREPDEPFLPDTFAVHTGRSGPAGCVQGDAARLAFDVSCPIFERTWHASYNATQAAVTAAEHVRVRGGTAYSLGRPPGHHAGFDHHGGFCYTNHAAAAAAWLARGGDRVAVLDIDYHHGNGTEDIFRNDGRVFTASLHADPMVDYPYFWGFADQSDATNRNVPLPHGTTDNQYLAALDGVLHELSDFGPKYLVLAAGFDLMKGDPVPRNSGFAITSAGLARIAGRIASLKLPTVIVQEGGYNLDTLGGHAVTLLNAFA